MLTNETKRIMRMLGATIQTEINRITGELVSLDKLESLIQKGDQEEIMKEILFLTKYKQDQISQQAKSER